MSKFSENFDMLVSARNALMVSFLQQIGHQNLQGAAEFDVAVVEEKFKRTHEMMMKMFNSKLQRYMHFSHGLLNLYGMNRSSQESSGDSLAIHFNVASLNTNCKKRKMELNV